MAAVFYVVPLLICAYGVGMLYQSRISQHMRDFGGIVPDNLEYTLSNKYTEQRAYGDEVTSSLGLVVEPYHVTTMSARWSGMLARPAPPLHNLVWTVGNEISLQGGSLSQVILL